MAIIIAALIIGLLFWVGRDKNEPGGVTAWWTAAGVVAVLLTGALLTGAGK